MREQGWGDEDVFELNPAELPERITVASARGRCWTPHGARVHPARYTRGLADVVVTLGVRIVDALEGYTLSLPGQGRGFLPMNSGMLITEPPARRDARCDRGGSSSSETWPTASPTCIAHRTVASRSAVAECPTTSRPPSIPWTHRRGGDLAAAAPAR